MISRVHISWALARLDPATLAQLDRIANVRSRHELSCTYSSEDSDPAAAEIESIIRAAGVRTLQEVGDYRQPHYVVSRFRVWEESDLDRSEYLQISIPFSLDNISGFVEEDTSEVLCVEAKDLRKLRNGFGGGPETLLCPDRTKRRLEAGSFLHLDFAPVKVMERSSSEGGLFRPVEGHQPWWQLRSDLVLPPMSPAIQRIDPRTGNELPREHEVHVTFREPPFDDFQPRYLRSDWDRVPKFDVAGSRERLLGGNVYHRMLIVSNRFYQFCKQEGWEADWVPVRIDPE